MAFGLGHAVEAALQVEQFAPDLLGIERGLLQRDTDAQPNRGSVLDDVVAGDASRTAGGCQERGEHAHRCGRAGAVGSEKAVDLAACNREIDSLDGHELAEMPCELDGFNCWGRH